jgi:Zn finger protein HypA/HybF involved in hydrogenase expression
MYIDSEEFKFKCTCTDCGSEYNLEDTETVYCIDCN